MAKALIMNPPKKSEKSKKKMRNTPPKAFYALANKFKEKQNLSWQDAMRQASIATKQIVAKKLGMKKSEYDKVSIRTKDYKAAMDDLFGKVGKTTGNAYMRPTMTQSSITMPKELGGFKLSKKDFKDAIVELFIPKKKSTSKPKKKKRKRPAAADAMAKYKAQMKKMRRSSKSTSKEKENTVGITTLANRVYTAIVGRPYTQGKKNRSALDLSKKYVLEYLNSSGYKVDKSSILTKKDATIELKNIYKYIEEVQGKKLKAKPTLENPQNVQVGSYMTSLPNPRDVQVSDYVVELSNPSTDSYVNMAASAGILAALSYLTPIEKESSKILGRLVIGKESKLDTVEEQKMKTHLLQAMKMASDFAVQTAETYGIAWSAEKVKGNEISGIKGKIDQRSMVYGGLVYTGLRAAMNAYKWFKASKKDVAIEGLYETLKQVGYDVKDSEKILPENLVSTFNSYIVTNKVTTAEEKPAEEKPAEEKLTEEQLLSLPDEELFAEIKEDKPVTTSGYMTEENPYNVQVGMGSYVTQPSLGSYMTKQNIGSYMTQKSNAPIFRQQHSSRGIQDMGLMGMKYKMPI